VSAAQLAVELVDRAGRRAGSATVAQAHTPPGQLHRAFSVLLVTPDEQRLLLQRRSADKSRFPLRWANTCCGHPAPGEPVPAAAARRLAEELGLRGLPLALRQLGVYRYRAEDPQTGTVEHEYDHVLLGELDWGQVLRPDPAEVADLRWVGSAELSALLESPELCAPWLAGVVKRLRGSGFGAGSA
jgi:isopentenyl-diphosphate delta-isomerase